MKSVAAGLAITAAKREDLPEILALLEECKLPKEGLATHLPTTLVARRGKEIVGSSALELYQELALLRSVAVKPSYQRRGLGRELTRAALDLAMQNKITNLYLLTETASVFFSKLGFKPIPRSEVPVKVQRSVEFTTLCPVTATVMTMPIRQEQ